MKKCLGIYSPILILLLCLISGCEIAENEKPIELGGDYYGEVSYVSYQYPLNLQSHKALITISNVEYLKFVTIISHIEGYSFDFNIDFDMESLYGEVDFITYDKERRYKGWLRLDGYSTKGEYKEYNIAQDGTETLGYVFTWSCSK